ncbi:chain length determinant protein [Paucilactobacillus hokkaidonensis JCM 18461]|uniref:Capsular polysaccharide biosynthesis protein CpsC n=2 Tax=Paucilactobacillus hokkaidonensis TaxID=1193095 RepID=A0A0A1GVD7_9LACO|nr:Wzz/FepE/Etk N-terminal domain-containing protein [Paucilactobacillus hokkaidonensis]BAP84813.1 chain length determinant protein [Paucilactobacillus hokkaidonensis JCM 18461]
MESTLDIRRMFAILRKHLLLIILCMVGFAIVAFGVAEFAMTAKYTSATQVLVNQKKDASNSAAAYQDQQADVQMISTYKDIITNQVILKQVKHDLANPTKVVKAAQKAKYTTNADGTKRLTKAATPAVTEPTGKKYDVSVAELQSDISISNEQNSQVFALNVSSDDPDKSAAIANDVADVFKTKIKDIMSVNNVTIVSKAVANDNKTSPRTMLIVLIGIVIGMLLSVGYAFAIELTDTTVKDDEFLTDTLGLTNLGQVAEIKMSGSHLANRSASRENSHRRVRV